MNDIDALTSDVLVLGNSHCARKIVANLIALTNYRLYR